MPIALCWAGYVKNLGISSTLSGLIYLEYNDHQFNQDHVALGNEVFSLKAADLVNSGYIAAWRNNGYSREVTLIRCGPSSSITQFGSWELTQISTRSFTLYESKLAQVLLNLRRSGSPIDVLYLTRPIRFQGQASFSPGEIHYK